MDRQTATKLIQETFQNPFDKSQFTVLCKNLAKNLDVSSNCVYQGNDIPGAYEQGIQSIERIGKYIDSNKNKLDVLIVKLKKEQSLEHARTMQRNFIAWYLKSSEVKDAGLVAFVSTDPSDWRFSLVKMEYSLGTTPAGRVKTEIEFTPARRCSFLVGRNESSHTAQQQLLPILEDDVSAPTLVDFEKAFSVEVVTREFFTKYKELFWDVEEALQKVAKLNEPIYSELTIKNIDIANFAKKLLGQIVFLYSKPEGQSTTCLHVGECKGQEYSPFLK